MPGLKLLAHNEYPDPGAYIGVRAGHLPVGSVFRYQSPDGTDSWTARIGINVKVARSLPEAMRWMEEYVIANWTTVEIEPTWSIVPHPQEP